MSDKQPEPCPFCGIIPEIKKSRTWANKTKDYIYHQSGEKCILGGMWLDMKKWNQRPI